MKGSSKNKQNNQNYNNNNNYEFSSSGFNSSSGCFNDTATSSSSKSAMAAQIVSVVSAASGGSSSGGGGGVGEIECEAGQENDPADGRYVKYRLNLSETELRPTTESTMLSSSSASSTTNTNITPSISSMSSGEEEEDNDDENGEINADDDGSDTCNGKDGNISQLIINQINNNTVVSNSQSFMAKFDQDYDGQVEKIAEKATSLISNGSFFDCGLYQFISFLFVSIAWTIGNGWYAYVSVFSGYTPEFECDLAHLGSNYTQHPEDKQCLALDIFTNQTVKCNKWIYDKSQLTSTIITEFGKFYFFFVFVVVDIVYFKIELIYYFCITRLGM